MHPIPARALAAGSALVALALAVLVLAVAPAAGFPLVLPLLIVILSSLPPCPAEPGPARPPGRDDDRAASAAAGPGYL